MGQVLKALFTTRTQTTLLKLLNAIQVPMNNIENTAGDFRQVVQLKRGSEDLQQDREQHQGVPTKSGA